MVKKPQLNESQLSIFRERFGNKKVFSQALMPIRGPEGFRKLDYEYANELDPGTIMKKIADHGFNAFGLVVKDTDGATLSNTKVGWNPTGRDLVKEFEEQCQKYDMSYILSVTNMNDAYRGWKTTEGYKTEGTVSIHMRETKKHKAGEIAVHNEGEMRVDLPEGVSLEEMQEKIPFLTNKIDEKLGAGRGERGQGYIPLTSFHCPRSKHIDYMIDLVQELVKNYNVDGIYADYIRYDGSYTDLCGCERCTSAFAEQYPGKKIFKKALEKYWYSKEWRDFREDNIAAYGKKFNDAIKETNEECITGWFNLPMLKLFTRDRIAQNYTKLGSTMDTVVPMLYPYLTGTSDDGRKWRRLANVVHWFFQKIMKSRFSEYGDGSKPVLAVTNSVECNAEEMLISCKDYDYGLGIALFKYYGTSEAQWMASKLYGEILSKQKVGDPAPTDEQIKDILFKVYDKFPPKNPHLLRWKPPKED
ncbi:MAG: family 10 glycosylhydrolase [Candidatus Hodarchaeota archaeon]